MAHAGSSFGRPFNKSEGVRGPTQGASTEHGNALPFFCGGGEETSKGDQPLDASFRKRPETCQSYESLLGRAFDETNYFSKPLDVHPIAEPSPPETQRRNTIDQGTSIQNWQAPTTRPRFKAHSAEA